MSFDPSQPFTIEDSPKVTTKGFDPSKPFEVEAAPAFDPAKAHAVEHHPDETDQKPGFLRKAADALESGLKTIGELPGDYVRFQIDAAKQVAKAQSEDLSTWYADKPGYTYGAVLPFRKNDKTGEVEWGYSPESARAIMRAAGHTLDFDINNPEHRSDVTALALAMSGLHRAPGSIPSASPLGASPPRAEPTFGEPPAGPAPDAPFGAQQRALTGPPGEPPAAPPGTAPQLPGPAAAPGQVAPTAPAAAPPLAIEAPQATPPAVDPWLPVAEAPAAQPQAETPIAPVAEAEPAAAAPVQTVPEEIPASDLKPGHQVLVGDKTHEVETVRPWTGDQVAVKLKDDPKLHIGAPEQPVQRVPSPETPAPEPTGEGVTTTVTPSPPTETAFGGPWVRVKTKAGEDASNRQGEPLYENANGVRATFDNGVPHTESVTEHPEKGLMPRNAVDRRGQFLTAEETGLGAAPPKPRSDDKGGIKKTEEKPTSPSKPASTADKEKPPGEWKYLADNEEGDPIYTNGQGVHSIVKDGVRIVETVRLRPTKAGMAMSVPPPMEKEPAFRPAVAAKPAPKTPPSIPSSSVKSPQVETPEPAPEPRTDSTPAEKPTADLSGIPKAVYRGTGRANIQSAYGGVAEPIAGPGRYAAFSKEDAEKFGPNIEELPVDLKNPLVIRSDNEWRALTKEAGWWFPNPFGLPADETKAMTAKLKAVVQAKGHDGIIAWWDNATDMDVDSAGNAIKTLRNALGVPQVVDYREMKAAPKEEPKAESVPTPGQTETPTPETVTHVTKKGKTLTGTIRRDLSLAEAKVLDPYAFKKDGGIFIRAKPAELQEAGTTRGGSTILKPVRPAELPIRAEIDTWANMVAGVFEKEGATQAFEVWKDLERVNELTGPEVMAFRDKTHTAMRAVGWKGTGDEGPPGQSLPEITQSAAETAPPEPMTPLPPEPAPANAISLAQGKGPVPVTAETALEEQQQESQSAPLPEEERADGLQGTIRDGDAGAGSEGVPEPDPVGPDGRAPAGEVGGGTRPAAGDPRPGAAGRTRGTNRGGDGGGGRTRTRDPDRLPDTREGSAPGDAGRPPQERGPDTIEGTNYVIEPGALAESRTRLTKARDNLAAIELVKRIKADGRLATRAEQEVLAKYVGWGGIKNVFRDSAGEFGKGLEDIGARLEQLLTPEEYRAANSTVNNAHYTAEHVVRSMWDAVRQMGFTGGSVFEPGMGVGHFLGLMPRDIAAKSTYRGIERDSITTDIAQLLYPRAGIRQADFTRMALPEQAFDLVIGNPPFLDVAVSSDKKYPQRFLLHDYFFAKSLDTVRPGGLLAFVTSAGTMNKLDSNGREYLAERAEFVGGIRLPSSAFRQNAMTEVTTDILFFKRRPEGKTAIPKDEMPDWTKAVIRTLPDREGVATEGNVSRYFSDHPEMVLGQEGFFNKLQAAADYAVHQTPGTDLTVDLREAIDRLPRDVMTEEPTPEQKAALDFSSTEKKDGSFYLKDGTLMQYRGGAGREVMARGKGVEGGFTAADRDRVIKMIPVRDALRRVFAADLAEDEIAGAKAREKLNAAYDDFVKWFGPINQGTITFKRPSIIQQEGARAEAREEARFVGDRFVEGDFDATPMYDANARPGEIARAREAARQTALTAGRTFNEGSFDPVEMPDTVIERRPNIRPFMSDPESYRLRSIENYDDSTNTATKKPIFTRSILTHEEEPKLNSAHDGVLWSLNKLGRFDVAAIAEKMGKSIPEIIGELGDDVFKVPGTEDTYQTKDHYLSGDVVTKLEEARKASEQDRELLRNVIALEAAAPRPLAPSRISMVIGMPWIPPPVVSEFARDFLQLGNPRINYSEVTGTWIVEKPSSRNRDAPGALLWGTSRRSAYDLLSDALNRTPPRVMTPGSRDDPPRFDPVATQAAQDMMAKIRDAFFDPETRSGWVLNDQTRANELADIYNGKMNREILRQHDGSYLTTPGVAASWSWRPHQTRVVSRIILEGNTYMAHAVGAGKTSAMIGAGMEMKRLGLVRKPMYAVPNHMLGQFTKEFYEQYPTARIAVADEERFHTDRRKQFIANVAQDDLDAVIITHSSFQKVPISDEFQAGLIQEQIDMLEEAISQLDASSDRITVGRMNKQREKLEQRLSKASGTDKDQTLTFEEMGVDFVFVDEAHLFRKLSFATKQGQMKGISPEGSNMSWDLFTKVRYLDSQRPGRSVVFASGTPITNTMGELYSLSRFMQPDALKARGLSHFDAWAQTFGTTKSTLEETAAGTYQPVTRFGKFVNMPELYKMVGGVMDIVTPAQLEQYVTRPRLKGGERQFHMAPRSEILDRYQATLGQRMEAIKARRSPPQPGDDIILSVINDGRHAAIDPRFVENSQNDPTSKLNMMIENVARIYHATGDVQFYDPGSGYTKPSFRGPATQMIFANLGVNGRGPMGFSGYRWMKEALRRAGVPLDHIAFIGDYNSTIARQKLFNDMNEGIVRILIGSTQKMGTGVNAQRRLIANHNQDPLWFPADDEQRNGRLVRQGNHNPEVEIHDYTTKGTYDSAMWQMMAKKAGFIEQFFRGDPTLRDMEDIGEASMYEQASAMSTTDERIITLTQLKQDLEKARRRRAAHEDEQWALRTKYREHLSSAQYNKEKAERFASDIETRIETTGKKFTMQVAGDTFTVRKDALEALRKAVTERVPTMGDDTASVIGNIGGFRLRLINKKRGHYLELMTSGAWDKSLASADPIASAEDRIRYFEIDQKNAIAEEAEQRRSAAEIEPYLGKEFEGGDEINRLDEAVRALTAILEGEAKAVERAKSGEPPEESVPEEGPSLGGKREIDLDDPGEIKEPKQTGRALDLDEEGD